MYQKYFKWFLNGLRAVLLLIALAAALVTGLWVYSADDVNQFGKDLAQKYTSRYQAKLNSAVASAETGNTAELAAFLQEIEGVKKQDRLDPIKRTALKKMIQTLRDNGDYEQALAWNDTWLAFDERDINASLTHAQLLIATQGRYEEGMAKLAELQHKVPAVAAVSDAYIQQLVSEKRFFDAFKVVDSISDLYLARTRDWMDKPWDVFWDTGESFNALQRALVEPRFNSNGELELLFSLEPSVRGLRIDPPPRTQLTISNLRIVQATKERKEGYSIPTSALKLNQIDQTATALVTTTGIDPYFIWRQPKSMVLEKKARWKFTAKVTKALPEALSPLFTPEASEQIVAGFKREGNALGLERYLQFDQLKSVPKQRIATNAELDSAALTDDTVIASVDSLIAADKYAEAYLLVDKKLGAFLSNAGALDERAWDIYWDTGNAFNAKQKAKIQPTQSSAGRMVLKFELEGGVSRLRVDPPPSLELQISNPEIATIKDEKIVIRSMTEFPLELNQVEQNGASLRTFVTNDPYFVYTIPPAIRLNEKGQWHVIADVEQILPKKLKALFTPAAVEKITQKLKWSGNRAALDRYTQLQKKHGDEQ